VTEELIGVAVAAAASVVGMSKGLNYILEKRNSKNNNSSGFVTRAEATAFREEFRLWCNERHSKLDAQRIETRTDATIEAQDIYKKLDALNTDIRLEILNLSTRIDNVLKLIPTTRRS